MKKLPTTTATQHRVALYQPTQRPRSRAGGWQETAFGRCRVTGRLGQRHADLVESVLYCAEDIHRLQDGGALALVDPARVRSTMSDSKYSLEQIQKLFVELRAAVVEIETPQLLKSGDKIIGGLIDHVVPSPMTRPDPRGGRRHLWVVRLGVALVMLLDRDLALYRNPAPLARLNYGISQAVARHALTHSRAPAGGWRLDTLIAAAGGAAGGAALRKDRARVRNDAPGLAAAGIVIAGDRVHLVKDD